MSTVTENYYREYSYFIDGHDVLCGTVFETHTHAHARTHTPTHIHSLTHTSHIYTHFPPFLTISFAQPLNSNV